jgi:hypothetical protein
MSTKNDSKRIKKEANSQVPRNREEMEAMVEATVAAQLELEPLIAQRDAAQLAAAAPFAADISRLQNLQARNLELLETWAAQNDKEFGKDKSIVVKGHRIGWRLGNWKTELKSKVTWAAVVSKLRGLINASRPVNLPKQDPELSKAIKDKAAIAKDWLRVKLEVSAEKNAMIAARDDAASVELLGEVGVKVVQEESFYLDPAREGQQPALLTAES